LVINRVIRCFSYGSDDVFAQRTDVEERAGGVNWSATFHNEIDSPVNNEMFIYTYVYYVQLTLTLLHNISALHYLCLQGILMGNFGVLTW